MPASGNLADTYRSDRAAFAATESTADENLVRRISREVEFAVRSAGRAMRGDPEAVPERAAERRKIDGLVFGHGV